MATHQVNNKKTAVTHTPNLLDQLGEGLHKLQDAFVGKKSTPTARQSIKPPRPSTLTSQTAPTGNHVPQVQGNQSKGPTAKNNAAKTAAPKAEVLHRFDGQEYQKGTRFFGMKKVPDRTHQVVQKFDANYVDKTTGKKGAWQVSVQPVMEGRKNPDQVSFVSNRKVTVKDFNNTGSLLSKKSVEATHRLNADSNRLPEATPAPARSKAEPKLSTQQWVGQQARNAVGGAISSVTSTVGQLTSLPELTGQLAATTGHLGKQLVNTASGGRVFKSANNPMVIDSVVRNVTSRPLTEQAAAAVQSGVNRTIGANAGSWVYKGAELIAPMILTKKGGSKPGKGEMVRARSSNRTAGETPGRPSSRSPGAGGATKPATHPVENLKNAVQLHKEGKISNGALNEAMTKANEAFKTQKGADAPSWSAQMRKDYIAHSSNANSVLSGAKQQVSTAGQAKQTSQHNSNKSGNSTTTSSTTTTSSSNTSGAPAVKTAKRQTDAAKPATSATQPEAARSNGAAKTGNSTTTSSTTTTSSSNTSGAPAVKTAKRQTDAAKPATPATQPEAARSNGAARKATLELKASQPTGNNTPANRVAASPAPASIQAPSAANPVSASVHVVKTPGGKWRLEHAHGEVPSLSAVVRAVAEGTLTPGQLKKANFSEKAIKGVMEDANLLKNTKSDSPAVPTSTARRPGESMHAYLARHGAKQSLNSAQQAAADNTRLRMSAKPEKLPASQGRSAGDPQLQRQPAPTPAASQAPQFAEPPTAKPLDVVPRPGSELMPANKPAVAKSWPSSSSPVAPRPHSAEATSSPSNVKSPTRSISSELPNPSQPTSSTTPGQATNGNRAATPQSPAGVPPGGVPPTGGGRVGGSGGPSAEPPRPPTPLENSSGWLGQPFRQSINPALRQIVRDTLDGSTSMGRYRDVPPRGRETTVNELLSRSGIDVARNPTAAGDLIKVAEGLDVNPSTLTTQLIRRTREQKQLVAGATPATPVLLDGSNAASLDRSQQFVTALLAQGVVTPAFREPFHLDPAIYKNKDGTPVDGKIYDILKKAGLQTASMNSDIDGPFAASYGMQGLDVASRGTDARVTRFHVELPDGLEGRPVRLHVPEGSASRTAVLEYEVRSTNRSGIFSMTIPVTSEQQSLIRRSDPRTTTLEYVEGLSARLFSPESVAFWKAVSQQNGAGGGRYAGNVQSPAIVFNTFGSFGARAFRNASELLTSFARSLRPREIPTNVPNGLFAAPDLTVYSGGSSKTKNGVSEHFGLSPEQSAAMKHVATQMPVLVEKYAEKYGLSQEATAAWQSSIFKNPDIPSIIIPKRTVAEFANRTDATHPDRTFSDLQREIEGDMTRMVNENGMGQFVYIHHTPSGPGDTVAAWQPGVANAAGEVQRPDYTTEWQVSVNGGKAMPVLDSFANDLKKNSGIDLKVVLEERGYSYGEIRKKNLQETIDFMAGFVRERIAEHELGQPVTPHVIVPVDTYYEAGGQVAGSDASLTKTAVGLYTPERTFIVQVDTGGGKPTEGRSPQFRLGRDASGNVTLDRSGLPKPSIDGRGPNRDFAPKMYARSAADMGLVFNHAYGEQSTLTRQEVDQMRRRQ